MHISEGILSAPVLLTTSAAAFGCVAYGLKKLPTEKLMAAGLSGALFFVASLIHVPVGISSAHLILNGLIGVMLGPAAFAVIFCALLLQALFFQFGGLTVLGLNTLTMGGGAIAAWAVFKGVAGRKMPLAHLKVASALAGFLGVFVSALLTAAALVFTDEAFWVSAIALLTSNLPVMIVEAILTPMVIAALYRVHPEVLL